MATVMTPNNETVRTLRFSRYSNILLYEERSIRSFIYFRKLMNSQGAQTGATKPK